MGGFRLRKKTQAVHATGAELVDPKYLGAQEVPAISEGQRESGQVERETVRLTLAVPRVLHKRLKLAAVQQELSIVSLVSGWIEERTVAA